MGIKILRFANLAKFVAVCFLAIGVQLAINESVLSWTMEWEGECSKRGLVFEGGLVKLLLTCGDREAYTKQQDVVVATAESDGTIHCAVYHYNEATCQLPEKKRGG